MQSEKMRKFSAPGRTELAGNHTDHNNGKVLAAAVQLENTASVQERDDNIVFFRSAGFPDVQIQLTDSSGKYDLKPKPEETGKTEALIRGIAAEYNRRGYKIGGFSANAVSSVLPGSGLSSSAALEVLIGRIFDSLFSDGKRSFLEIAQIGQIAENVYFGKPCGLMDQIACASGGAVAIDFKDTANPVVEQVNLDLSVFGFVLCVVNTGGSHADLTADYASIPLEMKKVAAHFGKSVLRELDKETVLTNAAEIRKTLGDRALLRSIHFFDENKRVDFLLDTIKQKAFDLYLDIVNDSGMSSWELLQNVYSPNNPTNQGISTALAITRDFLRKQKLHGAYSAKAACRVHGGGFAGTIQSYIPADVIKPYRACMEAIFGVGSVTELQIRPQGVIELIS